MVFSELEQLFLFQNMSPEEIRHAADLFQARIESVSKNQIVVHAGDRSEELCVVLRGHLNLEVNDHSGNRIILGHIGPSQCFGLARVMVGTPLLVNAVSTTDSSVLFLNLSPIQDPRANDSPWYRQFLLNLLTISSRKGEALAMRSVHVAPKKAQDRILSFLHSVSTEAGSLEFTIPYDQQQLADYLNLDRSVVSKELNRLKREGRLWFNRKLFILPSIEGSDKALT